MIIIIAKGTNKSPKTLRNVPEHLIEAKCTDLENEGYTRISVKRPPVKRTVKRESKHIQGTQL